MSTVYYQSVFPYIKSHYFKEKKRLKKGIEPVKAPYPHKNLLI